VKTGKDALNWGELLCGGEFLKVGTDTTVTHIFRPSLNRSALKLIKERESFNR